MKVEDVVLRVWETTRLKEAAALVQLYAAEGTKELKAEVKQLRAEIVLAIGNLRDEVSPAYVQGDLQAVLDAAERRSLV